MPGSAISSELVETKDPGMPIYCLDMSGQKFGAGFLQMMEQPTSWKDGHQILTNTNIFVFESILSLVSYPPNTYIHNSNMLQQHFLIKTADIV